MEDRNSKKLQILDFLKTHRSLVSPFHEFSIQDIFITNLLIRVSQLLGYFPFALSKRIGKNGTSVQSTLEFKWLTLQTSELTSFLPEQKLSGF